jgi:hypothetical protein
VVTSANMFSRYLGQSLGAALYGAIFNAAVGARLAHAPAALRMQLPHDVNAVIGVLHAHRLAGPAEQYLRHALYTATHHIYVGLVIVALVTLAIVLFTPRNFPVADEHADKQAERHKKISAAREKLD